ncbi:hypothetical protein PoB_007235500 [Plakobranchus ocellatus]|uniref:Uncharacterized protein n=1 Tax=Plakobranchus ocellatus TaxID=259542 RepID=A0AAV4DNX7_9GAST|nr:hypothetical protein PoB_007235500 [Plakobranchus ocellatus]
MDPVLDIRCFGWALIEGLTRRGVVHNKGDLRLSGPPSRQSASGEDRARDRMVPADLRPDSLSTVLLIVQKSCTGLNRLQLGGSWLPQLGGLVLCRASAVDGLTVQGKWNSGCPVNGPGELG